jgi:hypothetical protein
MRRRHFITMIGGAATARPLAVRAQQFDPTRRIGVLMAIAADNPQAKPRLAAFAQGLQQLGWIEGQNVRVDYRFADGNADDMRRYAAELVDCALELEIIHSRSSIPHFYRESVGRARVAAGYCVASPLDSSLS